MINSCYLVCFDLLGRVAAGEYLFSTEEVAAYIDTNYTTPTEVFDIETIPTAVVNAAEISKFEMIFLCQLISNSEAK